VLNVFSNTTTRIIDPRFLNLKIFGGKWLVSRSVRFTADERSPVPAGYKFGWAPWFVCTTWRRKNSWNQRVSNSGLSVVHSVATAYTDWATAAPHSGNNKNSLCHEVDRTCFKARGIVKKYWPLFPDSINCLRLPLNSAKHFQLPGTTHDKFLLGEILTPTDNGLQPPSTHRQHPTAQHNRRLMEWNWLKKGINPVYPIYPRTPRRRYGCLRHECRDHAI
jgi:hypothetical protein